MPAGDQEPVPRLPRSRGFRITTQQLVRIAMTALLLTMILAVRRPCSNTVSRFVTSFGDEGSAATPMPKPGTVEAPRGMGSAGDYEQLRPDMSEAEIKAAIERAKVRAASQRAGSAGSAGSAAP